MDTYTNAVTESGTVHLIWWANGIRQGRLCNIHARVTATDKPVTCKSCISKHAKITASRWEG